jgi:hypothetical protein
LALAEYEGALEVIGLFEFYATRNPRMVGDQHPLLPHLWLFETPLALSRLPRLVLTYTIEDEAGFVTLQNLQRL